MHEKKSQVQIGTESIGVSSDFNPTPPATPQFLFHPFFSHHQNGSIPHPPPPPSSTSAFPSPYKRPLLTRPHRSPSLSKSPTIYHFAAATTAPSHNHHLHHQPSLISVSATAKSFLCRFVCRIPRFRFRVHHRLLVLLSLPLLYFLVSHPTHSFLLDFLYAFSFSAALLLSLNVALPRLPSIRLFLTRSLPIKLKSASSAASRPLPVFWSIGSRPKPVKQPSSGCWVQVFSNGDIYEGEFHKGNCSGSGVYYYYMSGKYEGDWVDGKHDGYIVRGSGMGSECTGFTRGMCMRESGLTGRIMGVVCIPLRMGVDM